jgi:hypothetical protein
MRIDWVLAARAAKVRDDGTIDVLGAGIDTLVRAIESPTTVQVTLAMRLAGPARVWRQPQLIRVTVQPDGGSEPSLIYEESLTIAEAPALYPTRDVGVLLAVPCKWRQRTDGAVGLKVQLNDDDPVVVPVRVV